MAIVYFDSSALVKLLVDEQGSEVAEALWNGCDAAVSSGLAYPEVRAALAAARRASRLADRDLARAEAMWKAFWAAIRAVELTAPVAADAGDLARDHALGGADAVHLASLLALGAGDVVLATWDQRLRTGAQAAGAHLAPVVL